MQHIRSDSNLADIFTKSLGRQLHYHFLPMLGLLPPLPSPGGSTD
jgi:hypothetical protein